MPKKIIFGKGVSIKTKSVREQQIDDELKEMLVPQKPRSLEAEVEFRRIFKEVGHPDTDQVHQDYKYIGPDGCLYMRANMAVLEAFRQNRSMEFYTGPTSKIVCMKIEKGWYPRTWYALATNYHGFTPTMTRFFLIDKEGTSLMACDMPLFAKVSEDGNLCGMYGHRGFGWFVVEAAK